MPELINAPLALSRDGLRYWAERWRLRSGDSRGIALVALLAALVAAAIVTILWTSSRDYVPLYGRQELYDTAAVLQVLENEGIDFRLSDQTGQVLVVRDQVAAARMKLAARGVTPKLPPGIESLKDISSVSTSQFMEANRYTHALEGELAQTIMTLEGVRNARVHLALPKRTLFVGRDEQVPTASVMLDLSAPLRENQVEAIVNLVAASIPGLKANAVSVADQQGRLLSAGPNEQDPGRISGRQMEFVNQIESRIAMRASDMLTPILGSENFRVRVAADVDFSRIDETREALDGAPVLLSETSVLSNATDQQAQGVPGALANLPPLPEPDEAEAEQTPAGTPQTRNRREEINRRYATGKAIIHKQEHQARLRQLSVSVLVNEAIAPEGGWTQAQLQRMAELVQTAVGYNSERGDIFTLQSAPFLAPRPEPVSVEPLPWWQQIPADYLRYGIGSLLLLLLLMFGIRPLVNHLVGRDKPKPAARASEAAGADATLDLDAPATTPPRLKPETLDDTGAGPARAEAEAEMPSLPPPGSELEVLLKHLRLLVDKETTRVAEVIKAWVENSEHKSN